PLPPPPSPLFPYTTLFRSLLHRSIAANIRYGRPSASDEDVVAAARKAQAHEFILGLRDWKGHSGYEAHVGERGVKLSGGQRQRRSEEHTSELQSLAYLVCR